jgi:hypothetical protein
MNVFWFLFSSSTGDLVILGSCSKSTPKKLRTRVLWLAARWPFRAFLSRTLTTPEVEYSRVYVSMPRKNSKVLLRYLYALLLRFSVPIANSGLRIPKSDLIIIAPESIDTCCMSWQRRLKSRSRLRLVQKYKRQRRMCTALFLLHQSICAQWIMW